MEKKEEEDICLVIQVKMRSGQVLKNSANVKRHKIHELEQGLVKQICQEEVRWWYFVDTDEPVKTHLINLSHVENIDFQEFDLDKESQKCKESALSYPSSYKPVYAKD